MGNTTILQLPQANGLTGNEQIEGVQAGASVRIPLSGIAALGVGPQGPVGPVGPPGVPFPTTTPAEIAAGVTPVNLNYTEGDIRRYALTFGSNDNAVWNNCRAVCTLTGRPMVLAGLTLKFTAGIIWVYSAHGVEAQNAILDFTLLTGAAPALTIDTTDTANYQHSYPTPMRDFTLIGPGAASTISGIKFGTVVTTHFGAFAVIDGFYIAGFQYGITWGSDSWLQSIGSGKITACLWGIYYPAGLTNSGECINFARCAVTACTNGVYASGGNLHFAGLSLDYNTNKSIYAQGGGAVRANQFHLESNLDNDYWLLCQDANSIISLDQGDLYNTTSGTKTAFPIGQCNNSGAAQINLGDVAIQGSGMTEAKYGFGYIIDGHCTWNNLSYVNQTGSAGITAAVPCNGLSILVDGGFEKTAIVDWLEFGTGAQSAISTAQHYAGTQSMALAPPAGTFEDTTLWARCAPGANVILSLRAIGVGIGTDVLYFNIAFVDNNGNSISTNAISRNITTIPTGWTRYCLAPFGQAPAGTTWVNVSLLKRGPGNTNSDGNGTAYIDDAYLTITGPSGAAFTPSEIPPFNSLNKGANYSLGIPRGVAIDGIRIQNTSANAVTGGLNIGTAPGASDIASAVAIPANSDIYVTGGALLKSYPLAALGAQTLFFNAVSAFNSAILNTTIYGRRVISQGY